MIKVGFFIPGGQATELRETAGVPRVGEVVRLREGNYVVKEVHWNIDKDVLDSGGDALVVLDE